MSHSDFTVTLNTDGDAFKDPDGDLEIARILRQIADDLEERGKTVYGSPVRIWDVDSNRCGFWIWADRDTFTLTTTCSTSTKE